MFYTVDRNYVFQFWEAAEDFKSVHVLIRFLGGLREQGYSVVSELVPGVQVDERLNHYVDADEVTVCNLMDLLKGSGYLITVKGKNIAVQLKKDATKMPNPMDKHVDPISMDGALTGIFRKITKDNSISMVLVDASTYHEKLRFEFQGGTARECLAELAAQSKLVPKGYAVNLGKGWIGTGQSKNRKEWHIAVVTFLK